MGKSGVVGSGSLMSESAYLDKMEMTCIFESPDMIDDYMRASLKDIRPDKPLFEGDQTRRNNYSEDRLNLRHSGKRVATEPWLPDGTFLDFDGLAKDVRGSNAMEPDMKEHRKQQESRGKFIKYYDDGDYSVPGEGINEATMIKLKKSAYYDVKDRLKIFEESRNSFHNGGVGRAKKTNKVECMQQFDGIRPDIEDATCYNRTNYVTDLSNNTSIGWRRTTDNRFQIAKYGMVRKHQKKADQNVIKNRSNAHVEHDVLVSWRDQNTNKSVSTKMIDLSKRKQDSMKNMDNMLFTKSEQNKNDRHRKLTPADLIMAKHQTKETRAIDANVLLNGSQRQHVTGSMLAPILDSNRMKKVSVDPIIITYMSSVNRGMTNKKTSDLRDKIAQTSMFNGLLIGQSNRAPNTMEIKNEMLWSSVANYEKGESMKVANYGRTAKSMMISGPKDQGALDFEQYKSDQKTTGQKRGNISNPNMKIIDVADFDNDPGMEVTGTKTIGNALGKKYMRGFMDKGDTDNARLADVTSRTSRF